MRFRELLGEVWASTRAQQVSAIMVGVLVGAMCLTTLLTVGRSAAAEIQIAERMESAGSRLVVVRDTGDEDLVSQSAVGVVAALSAVDAAVGLTTATDVANGAVRDEAARVPARALVGDLSSAVDLVDGRWPSPGEALVSAAAQERLGMDRPFGYVTDGTTEHAVVGQFSPTDLVAELADGVVVASPDGRADYLALLARDAASTEPTVQRVLSILRPQDASRLIVETPQSLAQVQQQVAGDLGDFSRGLLLGVLTAGASLIAVIVLADVLLRRADLGRRRALGATRTVITLIVAGRVIVPAILGAGLGSALGVVITSRMGTAPPPTFIAATAVLALLAAVVASVPPAVYAANRDPVRVLRTP